jgi:hypothetical protein
MAALIQSLKARFAEIPDVKIDEDPPVEGSDASFHVESTIANCFVGVFVKAKEGSPTCVTIAMEVVDVFRARLVKKLTRTSAKVRVNANLEFKTRRITSMDDTQVLYYEMFGDKMTMKRALDCVALVTALFEGVYEHEARLARAIPRV